MKDYAAVYTNKVGVFPNVTARNITAPGDGLGTELLAESMNDNWGVHQQLMDITNSTPDGVTEATGASQIVIAMQRAFGHPGEVIAWHGQSDPSVSDVRLLPLEGQVVLISSYPELAAAVYVGDGNNGDGNISGYWKSSDPAGAVRDTGGGYLKIPDLRGAFVRGIDPGATRDPDGATRIMPTPQDDTVVVHGHELREIVSLNYCFTGDLGGTGTTAWEQTASKSATRIQARAAIGDMTGGTANVTETRAVNENIQWCVRY
jgi:hypothetical protein